MKINRIFIVLSLLFVNIFFSGCTLYYTGTYLHVSLYEFNDPENNPFHDFKNITNYNLSPYPTLDEALSMFFVPNNNLTYVFLEISEEENNALWDADLVGHICCYGKYFSVGFVA